MLLRVLPSLKGLRGCLTQKEKGTAPAAGAWQATAGGQWCPYCCLMADVTNNRGSFWELLSVADEARQTWTQNDQVQNCSASIASSSLQQLLFCIWSTSTIMDSLALLENCWTETGIMGRVKNNLNFFAAHLGHYRLGSRHSRQ